jgi:hypothetical protein
VKRSKRPLFVHPAYYALDQPRVTLAQLESLETPTGTPLFWLRRATAYADV